MKEQMNKGKENDQTARGGGERERQGLLSSIQLRYIVQYPYLLYMYVYIYIYTKYKGCVDRQRHLFLVFSYFILYEV